MEQEKRSTRKYWTKYEIAAVLGQRAFQISNLGSPVMVQLEEGDTDALAIAFREMKVPLRTVVLYFTFFTRVKKSPLPSEDGTPMDRLR